MLAKKESLRCFPCTIDIPHTLLPAVRDLRVQFLEKKRATLLGTLADVTPKIVQQHSHKNKKICRNVPAIGYGCGYPCVWHSVTGYFEWEKLINNQKEHIPGYHVENYHFL